MSEIWKVIPEFEDYEVSNIGSVKSFKHENPKILKGNIEKNGYKAFNLKNLKGQKTLRAHQLVAMAFLSHNVNGNNFVIDHINDNKIDNRVENLQIVTHRFNINKTQGKYTSIYKGVSWDKKNKKWKAQINIDKKVNYLGNFINEYDAHLAYQIALENLLLI